MYTVRFATGEFERKLRGKWVVCRKERETRNFKKQYSTISGYKHKEVAHIVGAALNRWPETMRRFAEKKL